MHGHQSTPAASLRLLLLHLLSLLPFAVPGIINRNLLSWLPPGSAVLNGGRGKHLIEQDLLSALDSSHLEFALLDVTDPEPLPESSRLWLHPKVRMTPHVASMTTLKVRVCTVRACFNV